MTVSTDVSQNNYTSDGTILTYPFTFPILREQDLVVQVKQNGSITTLVLNTDYSVTGSGNDIDFTNYQQGNIRLDVAQPSGVQIVIFRQVALTQETDYQENGVFPAEAHERALDKLTMITQENKEQKLRAITVDKFETTFDTELPTPIPNYYLAINSDGTGITQLPATLEEGTLQNVVDDTSPELGGSLNLNSHDIVGVGDISNTGDVTTNSLTCTGINNTGGLSTGSIASTGQISGNSLVITNGVTASSYSASGAITAASLTLTGDATLNDISASGEVSASSFSTAGGLTAGSLFVAGPTITDTIVCQNDITASSGVFSGQLSSIGANFQGTTIAEAVDATSLSLQTGETVSAILDEDDLASDSATAIPTQQSVKAYVDNEIANVPTGGGGGTNNSGIELILSQDIPAGSDAVELTSIDFQSYSKVTATVQGIAQPASSFGIAFRVYKNNIELVDSVYKITEVQDDVVVDQGLNTLVSLDDAGGETNVAFEFDFYCKHNISDEAARIVIRRIGDGINGRPLISERYVTIDQGTGLITGFILDTTGDGLNGQNQTVRVYGYA